MSVLNGPDGQPRHLRRIFVIWFVLSAIATPIVFFVLGPHLSPGVMTNSAAGQQWDMEVLLGIATPVMLLVYVWFAYNILVFRVRGDSLEDGHWYPRDNVRIQVAWVLSTAFVVLFLAGFGTYELIGSRYGAGGGEGPQASDAPPAKLLNSWKPVGKGTELQVQVIGQQWAWTYRYPQFGGMETKYLELPANTWVRFDVTSLDVIHDFWAFQLGVKADANPGVDNIAFTRATQLGRFDVRCDELCGIWHGAMVSHGSVVPAATFYSWAQRTEAALASTTKQLPKFSLSYTPSFDGGGGQYYQGRVFPDLYPNSNN